ncbi:MAG: D-alanyl-D-alanine carboxypeptidase [Clostridiales bacterium]|nr:D-alanyl-D-alanine carboxypeptidase [Clostridiales bacterium]
MRFSIQKYLSLWLVVLMLCAFFPYSATNAAEPPFSMGSATAIVVVARSSLQIIVQRELDTVNPVAGLSRIGPMLILSEAIDKGDYSLDGKVTISANAAKVPGPTAFVEANEVISADDLYKSAVMISAGDALYALCEAAFGSMDVFLSKLNNRMQDMGVQAVYQDPMGTNLKMSVSDLAKIGSALANSTAFKRYSTTYMSEIIHSNGERTELVNPNRFVRDLVGCTGLMTGSSNDAGYCGAFSVSRNGADYVAVVLGAKNSADRFEVARAAIEYAYASYKNVNIAKKGDAIIKGVPISGSVMRAVDLVALNELSILSGMNDEQPNAVYNVPQALIAPIKAGDCLGTVDYFNSQGERLATLELGVETDIEPATFSDFLSMLLSFWVCIRG